MAKNQKIAAAPDRDERDNQPESEDKFGFPNPTHTGLISGARSPDENVRYEALGQLVMKYEPPLKAYLKAFCKWKWGSRVTDDSIGDVLRSFVAEKVVRGDLIERFDKTRGKKFRSYLKTCIRNFAIDEYRREVKMGGLVVQADTKSSLEKFPADASQNEPPPGDAEWACTVVGQALDSFKADCLNKKQQVHLTVFARRRLPVMLGDTELESLEETAKAVSRICGENISRDDVSARQNTGEQKFRASLWNALSEYCDSAEDIKEEWGQLVDVLLWANGQARYDENRNAIRKKFESYIL